MKLGSLFSGYGGLDQAVHAAFGDVETAWVSDFDIGPNKILSHRFPDIPNLGDLAQVDWTQVEPVDIVTGGFPCQDVSLAGKRAGMTDGTRSNLWGVMRTAIETIRPRYVVAENVRGLLSARATSDSDMEPDSGSLGSPGSRQLRALGRVLGDLADIGYDAGWCGLRASDVGAPHQRWRVFIVAEDSLRSGSEVRTSVARKSASEESDIQAHQTVALLPTPKAGDADMGFPRTSGRPPEKSTHLATRLHYTDFATYAPAIERWEHVIGRSAPEPTEPNGKHRPRLSPRFVEWMMGLPDGWVTDVPDITRTEALRALGNGVVPQQGVTAIRHILNILKGQDA